MNTTTNREVNNHESHVAPSSTTLPTESEKRALYEYNLHMQGMLNEVRNPLSMTNLARTAMYAGATVAIGYAVHGIVGMFKGPDITITTGKPSPLK